MQLTHFKNDTGLNVRPLRDVSNIPFPQFEKPHPVGYFSITGAEQRNYEPTAQQLRYYKPPPAKKFPLDLDEGLMKAIKKPEAAYDERIDHLLKFISDHYEKLCNPEFNIEFVCWRGLLRLLMCTPYENRDDWCIHVTRYRGTFYLCKRDSEQQKLERANETERLKQMGAWGFKFEQYCLSESPFTEPITSAPVDECGEFSCVFKTKVGGYMEMLYGAEMDGIISEQPVKLDENYSLDNLKFVELKVRQQHLNQNQLKTYYRRKTQNWWCQSFLVGIQDIYVGMRNEKGLVQKIEHMEVRSLRKQGAEYWTPTSCVTFLIEFLTMLKSVMADVNCPDTTFEFYFNSHTSRITYECIKGKSEHSFLPDWYLTRIQRSTSTNLKQTCTVDNKKP